MTDPTDTPEPAAEEWAFAREHNRHTPQDGPNEPDCRCSACMEAAWIAAAYRTALSTDAPESLEALLARVRERWVGVTFRLRYYPQQSVGWKTERWLAEVGRVGNRHGFPRATGPTPHAALRALLQEDDDAE